MIDARELRIGNWVSYADSEYWIEQIHNQPVCVDIDKFIEIERGSHYDLYKPIELTEDILINCGFEYDSLAHNWYMGNDHFFSIQERGTWVNGEPQSGMEYVAYKSYAGALTEIKYLHQLQNLYYYLTGKELEIKEL